MKICSRCKENKPNSDFRKKSASSDGLDYSCKSCIDDYNNTWKKKNAHRRAIYSRKTTLKHKYGITEEQYEELLDRQNRCCAICDRNEISFNRKLAVDHNHITGEIRGLLCVYCNHRLVGRHRDGDLLRKIADYVDQGTGLYVPEKKKKKHK